MKKLLFSFIILLGSFTTSQEQQLKNNDFLNLESDNVAVSGYDVVAYFTKNQAEKGNQKWYSEHEGGVYFFSSIQHKELFDQAPEKYLPQYGGWCAYAMGRSGQQIAINPESFSIEKEKLYLFYKTRLTNTLKKWNANPEKLKSSANQNWKALIEKK